MQSDYAQRYFELERNHWWFQIRERIYAQALQRHLSASQNLRVLNVGAAAGRSSEVLAAWGEVTSVEYDPELCQFLQQHGHNALSASMTDLPFPDDSFDLVCALDVIEHVEDHQQGARELLRCCRSGGHVLLTVPAFPSLWGPHDDINHHFRRYTAATLTPLFQPPAQRLYSSYFNSLLFLPIWIYRNATRHLPRSSGGDFDALPRTSPWNALLARIFAIEVQLLQYCRFPLGVSLLQIYRKPLDNP